ncbi:hypothetical protein [Nocardioides jensenii]|nr:hypothetical protein [Nocardioides jensenii]
MSRSADTEFDFADIDRLVGDFDPSGAPGADVAPAAHDDDLDPTH